MLDNVELVMYMKFQKISMTGCRDMDKKYQNALKMGFSPICAFVPLWSFMQKLEKTNGQYLRYQKTDHELRTTDQRTYKGDYI